MKYIKFGFAMVLIIMYALTIGSFVYTYERCIVQNGIMINEMCEIDKGKEKMEGYFTSLLFLTMSIATSTVLISVITDKEGLY